MESDEDFMIPLLLAPFTWSTGGTEMAYRYHALTAWFQAQDDNLYPIPGAGCGDLRFPAQFPRCRGKGCQGKDGGT